MADITAKEAASKVLEEQRLLGLRRRSADAISHALFDEIRHLLPLDVESDVYLKLWEVVYQNGPLIISDREAERLGRDARIFRGGTSSERIQKDRDRLPMMAQMANLQITPKETSEE